MPQPTTYICTKCDFKGSSSSGWGRHSYSIDNSLIPIKGSTAICYTCNSIVLVEVLPAKDGVPPLEDETDFLKQKFHQEAVARFEALKDRESPARCLQCGSYDFELIPYVEPTKEQRRSELPIRTGLFHRNCGGRIYAEFNAPSFFMGYNLPERLYSIEGMEIEKPK